MATQTILQTPNLKITAQCIGNQVQISIEPLPVGQITTTQIICGNDADRFLGFLRRLGLGPGGPHGIIIPSGRFQQTHTADAPQKKITETVTFRGIPQSSGPLKYKLTYRRHSVDTSTNASFDNRCSIEVSSDQARQISNDLGMLVATCCNPRRNQDEE